MTTDEMHNLLAIGLEQRPVTFHRSHGFVYVNGRHTPPFISKKHKDNDPRRGMPVIICAWVHDNGTTVIAHQSLQ